MPTTRPAPAAEVLETCACFSARSAARAITTLYDDTLAAAGLRTTQLALLAAVDAARSPTMADAAGELGLDPSTMTRTLQPLLRDGLVEIERGAEDRRVRVLVLTRQGKRRLAEAGRLWRQAQATLERQLGSERFERLVADLDAVRRSLREDNSQDRTTEVPSE